MIIIAAKIALTLAGILFGVVSGSLFEGKEFGHSAFAALIGIFFATLGAFL